MKMLPHFTRLCISMLIVLAFCQVSTSYKPIMSFPDAKEFEIDEGEPLHITCQSHTPIKFEYPDDPKIETSEVEIEHHTGKNIENSTFQRRKTVFSDTGWYSCADATVKITRTYNPEVNWLYVYVRSNKSAFVETNTNVPLSAIVGSSIVIPCRTTSPRLRPTLIKGKEEVNTASFDSKIGFTITNLKLEDSSNSYKCWIEMNNKEYIVNYVLSVHQKGILFEPKIATYNVRYKGERILYMNCTVEVEISMRYVFDWNTPQQDNSRKSIQEFKKQHSRNTVLVTSQLTIFNLTSEDSGYYKCIIRTDYATKEIMEDIWFFEKELVPKFMDLIISPETNYSRKEGGSDVEWIVFVLNYETNRQIILQWFKPNGEKIVQSPKYFISYNKTKDKIETHLKINSLNEFDSGNYTLEINNNFITKKFNAILDVIDKPIPILMPLDSHYSYNESTEFRCEVTSNPLPNITWSFLKCPNYPSFENSTTECLTNVRQRTVYNSSYIFESIVKMPTDVSGKITCEACNEMGCDFATNNILVSDGLGAFGIIGPKESVTKGDNIELVCAASIYNYTNEFTWTLLVNQTKRPIVKAGRITFGNKTSQFTYRSILKLNNTQQSDAGYYICNGKLLNISNHDALYPLSDSGKYKLDIHDPVPPYFTKTNMNKTKTRIIDMITEGHNTMILQCYVNGMPKPTITWYKNNMLLKGNDQYSFKYNNQELHIKYLMRHNSGKYSCRAVSRLGTNETYQQIIVKYTKWHTLDIALVTTIPILGFILIILVIFFTIKIYGEKKMRKKGGFMHFEEGALECINPDLTVDEQAELLPYDKKWEFPRDRLMFKEQLGSGNFGVVMKAEAFGICKNENVTTVAVKMVHRTTNSFYIRALASELKVMVHLGKHLNIVNLLGACTKNISKSELLMIVEFCRFGNLHNYLLRHRNDFINQINPKTGKHDFTIGMDIITRTVNASNNYSLITNADTDVMMHYYPESNPDSPKITFLPDNCVLYNNVSQTKLKSNYYNNLKDQNTKQICTQDLLSWAFQVARGMEYLSQRKILHGDLAARNILLAEDNVVKICDFGLARLCTYYKKKSDIPVPIKWMAIESIRDRIFSTQSDVWSFGVMLWELFTLSETPYPGMKVEEQYQKLIAGYRMEQPDYAIPEVYDIMLQCWLAKPTCRPTFTDLAESIGNLLEESVKMHYTILNNPYMDINIMNMKNGRNDYLMMMSAPDHAILSLPIYKCMNSIFSNETSDSSDLCMNCPTDESKIFIPHLDDSNIEVLSPTSGFEDAMDLPLILKHQKPEAD